MNNPNRVVGGKKAKAFGKAFEQVVYDQAQREGYFPILHPPGCRTIPKRPFLIRVKNKFDFTIVKNYTAFFLDAKTFDKNTISASDLTEHQVDALERLEQEGFVAGYLVFFRKSDFITFFKASQLKQIFISQESLRYDQGIVCGTLLDFKIKNLEKAESVPIA